MKYYLRHHHYLDKRLDTRRPSIRKLGKLRSYLYKKIHASRKLGIYVEFLNILPFLFSPHF